jgi:predicted transport protein
MSTKKAGNRAAEDMLAAVGRSLQERTGRTLDEWVALVQASGIDPMDQKAVRAWLRDQHGVRQNSQWAIADAAARAARWSEPTSDEYIDKQYSGPKAALRSIYEKLAEAASELGDDVAIEGRGGYVTFIRKRQFAAVAVPSRTSVELGLRYVDAPASARLAEGNAPGQSTHKLRLASVAEVDEEVNDLLAAAYHQNG